MKNSKKSLPTNGVIVTASYDEYKNIGFFKIQDLKTAETIIKKNFVDFHGSSNLVAFFGICEYFRNRLENRQYIQNLYCSNIAAVTWAREKKCYSKMISPKSQKYLGECISVLTANEFSDRILLWKNKIWGKWADVARKIEEDYYDWSQFDGDSPF